MSGHTIAWRHSSEWIAGTITCHEPEGAPCRMICESGCESWGEDHGDRYFCLGELGQPWHEGDHQPECMHEYVPREGCGVAEWISDYEGAAECHAGEDGAPIRDGPIDASFPNGSLEWTYAEAAS